MELIHLATSSPIFFFLIAPKPKGQEFSDLKHHLLHLVQAQDIINVIHDLSTRSIGFKVLTGHEASIDTTTSAGKLVFGIFAALAEFERDLIY